MIASYPRLLAATILAFIVIAGALIASGVATRSYVGRAFKSEQELRMLRILADQAFKYQLDEETGLRGYTATRDPLFLQPYDMAKEKIVPVFDELIRGLKKADLPAAVAGANEAKAINAIWHQNVAEPLRLSDHRNANALERRGKAFVDRFRWRMRDFVYRDIDDAALAVDREAQVAMDRINALVALITFSTFLGAIAFLRQQNLAAERLAAERNSSQEQLRLTAEIRSAYEAEKRIADLLQDAIAQRPLPTLPALRFSATYVPATEEARVGGDWYDALELPDQRVLFAIGDVAGHGIESAVTMSRARQALTTAALLDADPAHVLKRVNEELIRQEAPMVTAVAGYADSNTYEFIFATAGHPPPILLEPNRPPQLLECGGMPLGVHADASYKTRRVQAMPGAMLILYTDGVVEHSHNVLEGERLLLEAVRRAADSPSIDPARVIHEAIFSTRAVGDDAAILTIGFRVRPSVGVTSSGEDQQNSFVAQLTRSTKGPIILPSARARLRWFLPARPAA